MKVRKMQTAAGGPLFPWLLNTEWVDNWKFRTTPASRSRVLSGKGVETDKQYTERRKKETTKRTWRSDAADIAHGVGEGVLALHPYTAIPYYGAKVGQDFLNGTYGWHTALNASVPLFHLAPQAVGLKEATNVALEDAANAGSKTARNWRVAREINLTTKNKPNIEVPDPLVRTKVGDVEINNPELAYRQVGKGAIENFLKTGELFVPVKPTGNKLRDALNNMMGGTPMYKQGSLWYGLNPINYPELFTTAEPLAIGNKHANIVKPWINPGKVIKKGIRIGEVDYAGKANLLGGRRVPFTEDLLNQSNVTSYKWVPGYGYKKVILEPSTSLKFFERKPSRISFAERVGVPKGERDVWDPQVILNAKEFANKYGYKVPLTIEEAKNMYRQHNRFFRSVETNRYEPKAGHTFFEYAPNYKSGMSEEEVIYGLYPEFKGLTPQQLRFTLASRGYPLYDRTYKINDIGKGPLDDFVFVSPSLAENVTYANSMGNNFSNTVMLQRPFSFGKPADWHINADWRPSGKINGTHSKGQVSEGNATLKNEAKISTKHLIPVKIAEKGDLGTFLGDYLEKQKYKGSLPYEINIPIEKQGGKMNILEFLKNGSGIHIKKKNRGKFTSYCGGKVTDECIRKAKASGNPTLVKRATFAANARKWKHLQGGTIVNGLMDIYRSIKLNQAIDASMDAMRQQAELDKLKLFYDEYKKLLGLQTDRSDIVNANKAYNEAKNIDYSDVNLLFLDKLLLLLNLKQQNDNSLISSIGGISGSILNSIGKKKNISSNNNKTFTTYSFWNNPTIKNSQVNNNFWTNPTIANATKNFNL